MDIMTRMGQDAFKYSGGGSNDFVRGLHSKADVDESERYICRFPDGPPIGCSHLFRGKGHRRGEPMPRAVGLLTGLHIVSEEPGQEFLSRLF